MSKNGLFSRSRSRVKSLRILVKGIILFCVCVITAIAFALPEPIISAEQKGFKVKKVESNFLGKFKKFFFNDTDPDETEEIPPVREMTWNDLYKLNPKPHQATWELQKQLTLDVSIKGFIIPLDYDMKQRIKEFLLVPYIPSCMHVPPPPPNQMVHVKLHEGKKMKDIFNPVEVVGHLKVSKTKHLDNQLTTSYSMDVRSMKILLDSGMDPFRDFFGNVIH